MRTARRRALRRTRASATSNSQPNEYSLAQYNFALFFGIAVQMYEATLVSDDTPWDRFRRRAPDGDRPGAEPVDNTSPNHISRLALFGAHLFNDRTRGATNIRCSNCHEQTELTDASARRIAAAANGPVRNRDGNVIDKGFNNIGVRPTADDLGVGGQRRVRPAVARAAALSRRASRRLSTAPPSPRASESRAPSRSRRCATSR